MALMLDACAWNGFAASEIGSSLTLCCPGNYQAYNEYGLQTENMPVFLRDYLVAEFDAAFQEKGLRRNDMQNDLRVELSYSHVSLDSKQNDIDPFVRLESAGIEIRYIAVIDIAMFDTTTGNKVWGGELRRIHNVSPGEYMHEGSARSKFLQAFRSVLSQYPG